METNNTDTASPDSPAPVLTYNFMTGDAPAFTELTERERMVAINICRGMNGHEIATSLDISVKTYDTHRGHILKKLGLRTSIELVLLAVKRGYVRAEATATAEA